MPSDSVMNTLFLHRSQTGGKRQIVPCRMGLLRPEHVDASIELHGRVSKGLSPDLYLPSATSDIVRYLNGGGITVGVWFEDRLICARTMKTESAWVAKSLREIELAPDPTNRTALTGYMVVDREFRGNNIQFLSYFQMENLLANDFDTVITTVAPKNLFSLVNIMQCGFYITELRNLYGDYLRYILRKKIGGSLPVWTNWHHSIPIREIGGQQKALAEGNVGYKVVHTHRGIFVLYGHQEEDAPRNNWHFRPRPPIRLL